MAVRIDGAGEALIRLTGLPSVNSFTISGWAYRHAARAGEFQYFIGLENSTANSTGYALLGWANNGAFNFASESAYGVEASPPTGQWFYWFIRCDSGPNPDTYSAGWKVTGGSWTELSFNANLAWTPAMLALGTDSFAEWCQMSFAHVRMWGVWLNNYSIEQEMAAQAPVRAANLMLAAPLDTHTNLADSSGNGDLTAVGTLSTYTPGPFGGGGGTAYDAAVTLGALTSATPSSRLSAKGGVGLSAGLSANDGARLAATRTISADIRVSANAGAQWGAKSPLLLPITESISGSARAAVSPAVLLAQTIAGAQIASAGASVATALNQALNYIDDGGSSVLGALLLQGAIGALSSSAATVDAAAIETLRISMAASGSARLAAGLLTATTLGEDQSAAAAVASGLSISSVVTSTCGGSLGASSYEATVALAQVRALAAGATAASAASITYDVRVAVGAVGKADARGALVVALVADAAADESVSAQALAAFVARLSDSVASTVAATTEVDTATSWAAGLLAAQMAGEHLVAAQRVGIAVGVLKIELNVTTPDCRTIVVSMEIREVAAAAEKREVTAGQESRLVTATAERREVTAPPERRTIEANC